MSKKDIAYAKGRVDGIRESGWQCGDCGNFYDASVDHCPNRLLDEAVVTVHREQARHDARKADRSQRTGQPAQFGYRAPERTADGKVIIVGPYGTREEAEAAADGLPIVELPPRSGEDGAEMGDFGPVPRPHRTGCPCEDGPCCPWMGNCDCQCMCDVIAPIEDRVRAEAVDTDASAAFRAGYETAVSEFMSDHGDDAAFQLGYQQAVLDITEKARNESGDTFATVEALMKDLNAETP